MLAIGVGYHNESVDRCVCEGKATCLYFGEMKLHQSWQSPLLSGSAGDNEKLILILLDEKLVITDRGRSKD